MLRALDACVNRQGFARFAKLELTKAVIQNKIPEFDPRSRSPWTEHSYAKAYLQEDLKKRPRRPVFRQFVPEDELLELISIARRAKNEIKHTKELADALEAVGDSPANAAPADDTAKGDGESQNKQLFEEQLQEDLRNCISPLFDAFVARFPSEWDRRQRAAAAGEPAAQ